jgi:signal transduction histidine kinase
MHARYDIAVTHNVMTEPPISIELKDGLFRIAQESLTNVAKHAGARSAHVSLESRPNAIVLQVSDDGHCFETGAGFPGHLGLRSMRERAELLGGVRDIDSAPGEGTRVSLRLPHVTRG